MGRFTWMITAGDVLRRVSCALLFGGSFTLVFAAIVLVKTAESQGIPAREQAETNAPMFISFSKVALSAGVALLIGECLDFAARAKASKLTFVRYVSSMLCAATTMIFAFLIIPPMEELRPIMKTNEEAHRQFHKLHELSRTTFTGTILLALMSLVLPAFEAKESRK